MRKRVMAGLGVVGAVVAAVAAVCLSSGCSSFGYLAQSVGGHVTLMNSAKPVTEWTADASHARTPAAAP